MWILPLIYESMLIVLKFSLLQPMVVTDFIIFLLRLSIIIQFYHLRPP